MSVENLVELDKNHQRLEHLGLTLAEAKALLLAVQRQVLTRQVAAFLASRVPCPPAVDAAAPGSGGTRTVLHAAPVYLASRQDSGGSGSFGVADRVAPSRGPWLALLVDTADEEKLANARRSGDSDVALVGPEVQP